MVNNIDPHRTDEYYDGRTGQRISDAEWDESQRRIQEAESTNANH